MAFVTVATDRTDSPVRAAAGQGWSFLPNDSGWTELAHALAGCATCVKLGAHGTCDLIGFKVPQGSDSWDTIPATKRLDWLTYRGIFQGLWQLDYIINGHILSVIYNAGSGGDNATQEIQWEITSVSGATLTLYGINPKRLQLGESSSNPDWPLEGGALETTARYFALRVGAMVRFLPPSVLAGKLNPYIVSISPPASNAANGVTFTVTLSASASNAKQPYDAAYPPSDGKYYCSAAFTQFHDADWPNVQPPVEGQFAPQEMTWTRAEAVSASGILALLDADGNPTRIIPPGVDPTTTPVLTVLAPGGNYTPAIGPLLTHTQVGYLSWTTVLSVVAILAADATATGFEVTFWAGATASDTERLNHRGQCGNCQFDPSASYAHHDGWRCTQVACSQFATFKRNCWQPSADAFNLADEGGGFQSGNVVRPAARAEDGGRLAAFWTASAWVLTQDNVGDSGTRNFRLVRPTPALPSMQYLCGAWSGGVPSGIFQRRTEFQAPAFGQLVESVDGDGNDTIEIVLGAFVARGTWTAGTTPDAGLFPTIDASWTGQQNYADADAPARLNLLPCGGVGGTHLWEWDGTGSAFGLTNRRQALEAIVSGINPATSDATLEPRLRARAGAI